MNNKKKSLTLSLLFTLKITLIMLNFLIKRITLCILITGLFSCGQKGPLYLPDAAHDIKKAALL